MWTSAALTHSPFALLFHDSITNICWISNWTWWCACAFPSWSQVNLILWSSRCGEETVNVVKVLGSRPEFQFPWTKKNWKLNSCPLERALPCYFERVVLGTMNCPALLSPIMPYSSLWKHTHIHSPFLQRSWTFHKSKWLTGQSVCLKHNGNLRRWLLCVTNSVCCVYFC